MTRSKLDSINEFARQGYLVRVTCANCHHVAELNPVLLMQQLHMGRKSMEVERLERQMRCRLCQHRGARISAASPDF
ncbi:hypothetical protein [Aurantiacibacter luteus]|uniref:hypothetical protein n=1 Tax=Aurantiacibacter luteus TaxID=1581420 RepID=UPI0012DFF817|nr:hypothetical protein [Aurantiacibacter luteus]